MKFPDMIVSTHSDVLIYKNGNWMTFEHKKDGKYYGITWDKNNLYIATSTRLIRHNRNKREILSYKNSKDTHQIQYRNSHIYIANTNHDLIDVFDPYKNKIVNQIETPERIILKESMIKHDRDITHINSIFFDNVGKAYVCHHNDGKAHISVWQARNFKHLFTINNVGNKNHNVYVKNSRLYTLNSYEGYLVVIDIVNKTIQNYFLPCGRSKIPITYKFGRGMGVTKDYLFIGISETNPTRKYRENSFSWILVYDMHTLKFVDKVKLPIRSQVKELRIISEFDYAHSNGGIPFPYKNLNIREIK